MEQYYTPSGKSSPLSFILWIVAALIAFPILAFIYAYAVFLIPFPYFNFFITCIFGYAIGLVISNLVLRIGKVRSMKMAFVFCLFGALTALYFSWAVWVDLVYHQGGVEFAEVLGLALNPSGLFEVMKEINLVGAWGFGETAISGVFLSIIWIIEILMVIIVALFVGVGQATLPFCEVENKWFEENKLTAVNHFTESQPIVDALVSGDNEALNELLVPSENTNNQHHATFTLFDAKSGENFVSLDNQIGEANDEGEITFSEQPIISLLKISQEVADRLKAIRVDQ